MQPFNLSNSFLWFIFSYVLLRLNIIELVPEQHLTGGGAEAQTFGEKMSSASSRLTVRAIPMPKGCPSGNLCTEKEATMIFNNDCQVKYNHDKELLEVVMAFPTWVLTLS